MMTPGGIPSSDVVFFPPVTAVPSGHPDPDTCPYGPCDLPPEPGQVYCTLHGVKWGRGAADPDTAREAAERVQEILDLWPTLPRITIRAEDARALLALSDDNAVLVVSVARAAQQVAALLAKVEAVQAVRLAMHADVFPGSCDRVGVLGAYLADLDAVLGSS